MHSFIVIQPCSKTIQFFNIMIKFPIIILNHLFQLYRFQRRSWSVHAPAILIILFLKMLNFLKKRSICIFGWAHHENVQPATSLALYIISHSQTISIIIAAILINCSFLLIFSRVFNLSQVQLWNHHFAVIKLYLLNKFIWTLRLILHVLLSICTIFSGMVLLQLIKMQVLNAKYWLLIFLEFHSKFVHSFSVLHHHVHFCVDRLFLRNFI